MDIRKFKTILFGLRHFFLTRAHLITQSNFSTYSKLCRNLQADYYSLIHYFSYSDKFLTIGIHHRAAWYNSYSNNTSFYTCPNSLFSTNMICDQIFSELTASVSWNCYIMFKHNLLKSFTPNFKTIRCVIQKWHVIK